MDVFRVNGGRALRGTVQARGAKNAALPIFAAALLTDEPVTITNVPDLSDIRFMAEIIRHLGAEAERVAPDTWRITAKRLTNRAPYDLAAVKVIVEEAGGRFTDREGVATHAHDTAISSNGVLHDVVLDALKVGDA